VGERAIKNTALGLLMALGDSEAQQLCYDQFTRANNMTDELAAFGFLVNCENEYREKAITAFFNKWKHNSLVMQKWFAVQSGCDLEDTFDRVQKLEKSSIFNNKNPNLVRALWGSFGGNHLHFHHKSGRGYRLIGERVLLMDHINPNVSSHLAKAFRNYRKVPMENQDLMKIELEKILKTPKISKNLLEVVGKTLNS
jgi:aminopeptidase N